MRIICIEEHTVDPRIDRSALPILLDRAPYLSLQTSGAPADAPHDPNRQTRLRNADAAPLGEDLGARRLANMDAHGIQAQVISHIALVQVLPAQQAVELARAANERLAAAVREYPDRYAGFAVLPWQDAQAATDELTRAVEELGFRGSLIAGRPGDRFLDEPRYLPVLRRHAELGVPLYIHPFAPMPVVTEAYYGGLAPAVSAELALGAWGWHLEAGVQVIRLILAGLFETLPKLQVISGHWGEMVPFYLNRLDFVLTPEITKLSRSISDTYRQHVSVTPSGLLSVEQFDFVRKVLGIERIIWSTDYPYLTMDGVSDFIARLPITEEERALVAHGNAERLLRLGKP